MGKYRRQSVAGLMMEDNSQKHRVVSRYCGRKFSEKSAAYVSAAREVLQLKFIADLIWKASLAPCIEPRPSFHLSVLLS